MADILFAEQVVEFGLDSEESTEYVGAAAGNNGFEVGSMYTVVWDGTTYECECVDVQGMSVIGNTSAFTGTPSDIPFLCYYDASEQIFVFGTEDTSASHTVAIYKGALDEEIPGEEEKVGANIVLFDRNGNEVTYEGIETVTFNTDVEGETATYTHGTVLDEVPEVAVDFTDGNQIVNAETGKLIKSVVIKKPETLIPENIAKDVVVAGITGTLEAGGDGTQIDFTDENLKFFGYKLDNENNLIYICFIDYEKIYEHTGSYDVNIPSTIGGYEVVLVCA